MMMKLQQALDWIQARQPSARLVGEGSTPVLSPSMSMPVRLPNPNWAIWAAIRSIPMSLASL